MLMNPRSARIAHSAGGRKETGPGDADLVRLIVRGASCCSVPDRFVTTPSSSTSSTHPTDPALLAVRPDGAGDRLGYLFIALRSVSRRAGPRQQRLAMVASTAPLCCSRSRRAALRLEPLNRPKDWITTFFSLLQHRKAPTATDGRTQRAAAAGRLLPGATAGDPAPRTAAPW